MSKGLRIKVGEGDHALFWKEPWAQNVLCKDQFHKLFGLSIQKNATVRAMGEWVGEEWRWQFRWRRPLGVREVAQLAHMTQWLSLCPLKQGVHDEWIWSCCKEGCYTVKSAYALLIGEDVAPNNEMYAALWECNIPSNIAGFGWRLLVDRLPTRSNLRRRAILQSAQDCLCPLCGEEEETSIHLMWRCTKTQPVWRLCDDWLGVSAARPAATGEHLLQFDCVFFNKEQNRAWRMVWFAAAWTIWLGRNSAIFRGVEFEPAKAFELLRLRAWKWLRAREVCFKASLYDWKIHPAMCLKCF